MKIKAVQIMRYLINVLETLILAAIILFIILYPSVKSSVEIGYSVNAEQIQVTGSDLVLSVEEDEGLHEDQESSFLKRTYEFPLVASSDLSKMDETMSEIFTNELSELASAADSEHVVVAVDQNGFLIVYDPGEYLDIQDDLPVFKVSIGSGTGYVFGFAPATTAVAE